MVFSIKVEKKIKKFLKINDLCQFYCVRLKVVFGFMGIYSTIYTYMSAFKNLAKKSYMWK